MSKVNTLTDEMRTSAASMAARARVPEGERVWENPNFPDGEEGDQPELRFPDPGGWNDPG